MCACSQANTAWSQDLLLCGSASPARSNSHDRTSRTTHDLSELNFEIKDKRSTNASEKISNVSPVSSVAIERTSSPGLLENDDRAAENLEGLNSSKRTSTSIAPVNSASTANENPLELVNTFSSQSEHLNGEKSVSGFQTDSSSTLSDAKHGTADMKPGTMKSTSSSKPSKLHPLNLPQVNSENYESRHTNHYRRPQPPPLTSFDQRQRAGLSLVQYLAKLFADKESDQTPALYHVSDDTLLVRDEQNFKLKRVLRHASDGNDATDDEANSSQSVKLTV